jgi:hypothetical protein
MGTKKKPPPAEAKPRQTWTEIVQLGLKAQKLMTDHAAELGKRTPPAFVTSFGNDLAALNGAVSTVIIIKKGTVQLTAAQNAALTEGYNLVTGTRISVRGQTSDKDVRLAYGVGTEVPMLVKDVKAALQQIINRVKAQPAEADGFGIVDDDLTAMQAALDAITKTDQAQEAGRATAPLTTKERNAIAKRLLAGVKRIAGAGMRAFAADPTVRANFVALR